MRRFRLRLRGTWLTALVALAVATVAVFVCWVLLSDVSTATHDPSEREEVALQTALTIETSPSGAQLFVNGAYAGTTPLRRLHVVGDDDGGLAVELRKPGYDSVVRRIRLPAGQKHARLRVVLAPKL